jgi:glycine hydroxymethyltransferase
MLVDLRKSPVDGKTAQLALEAAGITANRNAVPFDERSPFVASGVRIGTPAVTTRGMREEEMRRIGRWISEILGDVENTALQAKIREDVRELCGRFPLHAGSPAAA